MRKLAKQLAPLRSLYAAFCRRCPYTAETLERFVEVGAAPMGTPPVCCLLLQGRAAAKHTSNTTAVPAGSPPSGMHQHPCAAPPCLRRYGTCLCAARTRR